MHVGRQGPGFGEEGGNGVVVIGAVGADRILGAIEEKVDSGVGIFIGVRTGEDGPDLGGGAMGAGLVESVLQFTFEDEQAGVETVVLFGGEIESAFAGLFGLPNGGGRSDELAVSHLIRLRAE